MVVTPINGRSVPLETITNARKTSEIDFEPVLESSSPTFLDVFNGIVNDAVETNAQKTQDMYDLMLGNTDDVELIQTNIAKAQIAMDLLVTVKNSLVDSYNEIIKMQI